MTDRITNPVKAIRAKCLDCCCGSSDEVKLCHIDTCALHPFRLGRNPYRSVRQMTPEAKLELSVRLANARTFKAGSVYDG